MATFEINKQESIDCCESGIIEVNIKIIGVKINNRLNAVLFIFSDYSEANNDS